MFQRNRVGTAVISCYNTRKKSVIKVSSMFRNSSEMEEFLTCMEMDPLRGGLYLNLKSEDSWPHGETVLSVSELVGTDFWT